MVSFPFFSSRYLVVCSGDVLLAPRVVVVILRDVALTSLSKPLLVLVDEDIALLGGS